MNQTTEQTESSATSVSKLREQTVTLGMVLRVPLALAEQIEGRIENYFSGKIVYVRWSAGRLFITDKDPRGRDEL